MPETMWRWIRKRVVPTYETTIVKKFAGGGEAARRGRVAPTEANT
jgi:hypothetical protein